MRNTESPESLGVSTGARPDRALAWIALRMVPGMTGSLYLRLLERFGSPEAVFGTPPSALLEAGMARCTVHALGAGAAWEEASRELERARAADARIVTRSDDEYPASLRGIDGAPYLYVRGVLAPGDDVAVAIVGSRAASAYGVETAARFAAELSAAGVTVVSGLAHGIDTAAHRGALVGGGRTIAVLGSGLDVVYPRENATLARDVAMHGAVVSQFFMGAAPRAHHFPIRNATISGLARATVVVEATERSGSLITARCALEQGREVFAVPGPVMAPRSRGAHLLLRQGAKVATCATDILEDIGYVSASPPRAPAAGSVIVETCGHAGRIVEALRDGDSDVDSLAVRTDLTPREVLRILLELELGGVVRQLPGGMYNAPPAAEPSTQGL